MGDEARYAGHWLLKDIMSSVVDYDEFLSGRRREGQFYMILDFIPKVRFTQLTGR